MKEFFKKYLTKYEFRWAIIFTIVTLIWAAFEYEMGWHDVDIANHKYYTFLFLIPFFLCYYLFFVDKRNNRFKKRFKFKHAFSSGLGLTILVFLFSIPTQLLIHYLVSPFYLENAEKFAVESGEMSSNAADIRFSLTNYVMFLPVLFAVFGTFLSFVLAILMKKRRRFK